MPATKGEQILLAELQRFSSGQAAGSFGAGQALALLDGYIKIRDRVVALEQEHADDAGRIATLEGEVADLTTRTATLEGQVGDLEARVAALENPPAPSP